MLDQTDFEIINLLSKNSRIQWREIGEKVHLTGQAVANRIRRMEDMGIIVGYTVKLNKSKLGKNIVGFVTIFMKTADHTSLQKFINENELILEADKVTGEGCYLLKINASNQEELTEFLDKLLKYGNYKINLSIGRVK